MESRVQSGRVGAAAEGFEYRVLGDRRVLITHVGRTAVTLRGTAAARFLHDVGQGDAQLLMARATGNYKRGNEKVARDYPRNRRR